VSDSPAVTTRSPLRWLGLAIIAALVGLVVLEEDLRSLLAEAISSVSPLAVLATVPGQTAAFLLCGAALHALRPGVGPLACLESRVLRDGGDNLLVFLPGVGDAIGARALVLTGGRTRAAISATALDKLAEIVAQVPYILLALFIFARGWDGAMPGLHSGALLGFLAIVGLAVLALLLLRSAIGKHLVARLHAEWHLLRVEISHQKQGFPLSTFLHFLAWVMGGVQIWMASRALGYDVSFFEAVAIESAAYAGRALLIFIPAGLVTQELGLVAAGLLFGLAPAESLTLGLVLRLRDILFGLPLLLWPWREWRRSRQRPS